MFKQIYNGGLKLFLSTGAHPPRFSIPKRLIPSPKMTQSPSCATKYPQSPLPGTQPLLVGKTRQVYNGLPVAKLIAAIRK